MICLVVWKCLEHEWIIVLYLWNFIIPTDELIFFRGVAQPPSRYVCKDQLIKHGLPMTIEDYDSIKPLNPRYLSCHFSILNRFSPCHPHLFIEVPHFENLFKAASWKKLSRFFHKTGKMMENCDNPWNIASLASIHNPLTHDSVSDRVGSVSTRRRETAAKTCCRFNPKRSPRSRHGADGPDISAVFFSARGSHGWM